MARALIWIWHTPSLYILALENLWWHMLEHASFLFSAWLFWWSCLRANPRQVPHALRGGAVLVDDSYNANPGSVAAAIAALAETGTEAWLVLGDMGELGEGAEALHAEVGERARRAGIKRVWTVGELSAATSRAFGDGGHHFNDQAGLLAALGPALAAAPAGLRCLVKGSRSSAMDKVVAALLAADRQGDADDAA